MVTDIFFFIAKPAYTLWKNEEYFNPEYSSDLKKTGQLALPKRAGLDPLK